MRWRLTSSLDLRRSAAIAVVVGGGVLACRDGVSPLDDDPPRDLGGQDASPRDVTASHEDSGSSDIGFSSPERWTRLFTLNSEAVCGLTDRDRFLCYGADLERLSMGRISPQMPPNHPARSVALTEVSLAGRNNCGVDREGTAYCWNQGSGAAVPFSPRRVAQISAGWAICWLEAIPGVISCIGPPGRMAEVTRPPSGEYLQIGVVGAPGYGCGIRADTEELRCWGESSVMDLSNPPVGKMSAVQVGNIHACALMKDTDILRCWGESQAANSIHRPREPVDDFFIGPLGGCALVRSTGLWECWEANSRDVALETDEPRVPLRDVQMAVRIGCGFRVSDDSPICWGEGQTEIPDPNTFQ